ncbi:Aldo/keto reductase [Metarhizium album ARSEF 1941]|uniref:Aldo/keto reductase n=1 Tax=Metarhizium album (strain ARSEF 1941) TaxID=1081103 RepID=A0A0B2WRL6_METAS|nr:Aldo/keto reductase [Metarhizium album ARSEF 1941]KHN96668.1 Aldo/keto reductase [Metarhizium album ARSEF 1941]
MPTVVGKQVGPIGYGLMSLGLGLGTAPDSNSDESSLAAIKTAVECGCTFLNGAEFYGRGPDDNSLALLRRYFARYPQDADRVVVNIKGGRHSNMVRFDGSKAAVTASIEHSLQQLGPAGRIAQWALARKDPSHDYQDETLAAIDAFVRSGRIDGISTSEINRETLRSPQLSLFHTDPLTNGLLAACAELDIPVVAYSPLARGLLGGRIKSIDDLAPDDPKRRLPQFQDGNLQANLKLVEKVAALAREKGCTPAQVSLNWLLSLSKRPGMPVIIPIPGSSDPERIKENATITHLTDDDLAEIDAMLRGFVVAGERYPAAYMGQLQL